MSTLQKHPKKNIADNILDDGKIPPIEKRNIGEVSVRLMFDVRKEKKDGLFNIAVCVTYSYKRWYYPTGETSSFEDYLRIVKAGTQGKWCEKKKHLLIFFNHVVTTVTELIAEGFSLEKLKERIGKRSTSAKTDLFDYWIEVAESKNNLKTKLNYISSLSSFKKFRKNVNLMLGDVTETIINDWKEEMKIKGNSTATQSMYLRSLRAVLNSAIADNIVIAKPKITVPIGRSRTDNFLHVTDILKLKSFVIPETWTDTQKTKVQSAIDWWLLLYCCNGCNAIDLANLKWNNNYLYDNELSFIRSKIKNKKEIEVKIPIIPELEILLKKHGSIYEKGKFIFPQILEGTTTENQRKNRIDLFNKDIREGLVLPCKELGIRSISTQFARNSFITCLTHHCISDSYIDRAVGHADNLLRGYQGEFSKKKRLKFNKLLFVDPETED